MDWSPGRGSEQLGDRPSVVISLNVYNRNMPTVVVAACTTTVKSHVREGKSPVAVYLPAGQPLPEEGSVLGFQVMTASQERLRRYAGRLTAAQMAAVDQALATSFGLKIAP
jgi:mRNA-degrading endonuclease toxin of MazEF toxin-antitoxin module